MNTYAPKIPRDIKIFALISLVVILVGLIIFRHYYSGTITINSNPPATVYINGKQVSGTEFKLMPGDYQIEVKAEGYILFSESAHVGTGLKTEVRADLKLLPQPEKISDNASYLGKIDDNLYFGCTAAICSYNLTEKKVNTISNNDFADLTGLKVNPQNQQLALVKKGNSWGLLDFQRYDLINQIFKDFGGSISDIVYNSLADNIFYFTKENDLGIIKKAQINNNDVKNLGVVRDEAVNNPSLKIFGDQSLMLVDKDVFIFDLNSDNANKLTTSGNIVSADFTPEGKILYSVQAALPDKPNNYQWAMMDGDGKNKKNLDFTSISPIMAFFDSKNVLVYSGATFDKINLDNGNKISYYFAGNLSPLDLVISPDGKSIFVISDHILWEIELVSQ